MPSGSTTPGGGGSGAVSSVFTRTGAVVATAGDYNLNQVGNATGDYSLNSHKIISLANGSAASDAAAFGQIPPILFDSTLGADAPNIDTGANGIAGTSRLIEIWILARTDDAASASAVAVTFNNDTGSNYDQVFTRTVNATVTGGNNLAQANFLLDAHGGGGGASYAAATVLTIPGYAQTTFFKVVTAVTVMPDSTAANNVDRVQGFAYKSTTAISRMKVAAAGGATNLKAGSRLLILGR